MPIQNKTYLFSLLRLSTLFAIASLKFSTTICDFVCLHDAKTLHNLVLTLRKLATGLSGLLKQLLDLIIMLRSLITKPRSLVYPRRSFVVLLRSLITEPRSLISSLLIPYPLHPYLVLYPPGLIPLLSDLVSHRNPKPIVRS